MKVLVLTNHFSQFYGSEVVALEVAKWFFGMGDDVSLVANLVGEPISHLAAGIKVSQNIEDIDLTLFDLVWCQHNLLNLLPLATFAAAIRRPPLVAIASLSPFEPYEHVDGLLAKALSAKIFANSPETAYEIARRNPNIIDLEQVVVFYNATPHASSGLSYDSADPAHEINSITIVSNSYLSEFVELKSYFEVNRIKNHHFGYNNTYRLFTTEDALNTDAVITIGKTVVNCITQAKPVFLYGPFGGDGWLTSDNFEQNLLYNFSGRPTMRRISASEIFEEIVSGYHNAKNEICKIRREISLAQFMLSTYLSPLREQAMGSREQRAVNLREALQSSYFRAHLEASRQNSFVMRRNYLYANGRSLSPHEIQPNLSRQLE